MDIYVISNVWAREGSAIVGAAADAELAEEIANRVGAYRWSPWEEHGGTRERTAMLADGTAWPKLRQEIVCVPLAGVVVEADSRLPDGLARALRDWSANQPVTYHIQPPVQPPSLSAKALTDAIKAAMVGRSESIRLWGSAQPRIRVGPGAAKDWLDRIADSALPPKMQRPIQIDSGLLAGLPIVVDPSVPVDQIRIGPMVYVIGDDGMMTIVDSRMVPTEGFTTPPA